MVDFQEMGGKAQRSCSYSGLHAFLACRIATTKSDEVVVQYVASEARVNGAACDPASQEAAAVTDR
jgi:hypothetical protein